MYNVDLLSHNLVPAEVPQEARYDTTNQHEPSHPVRALFVPSLNVAQLNFACFAVPRFFIPLDPKHLVDIYRFTNLIIYDHKIEDPARNFEQIKLALNYKTQPVAQALLHLIKLGLFNQNTFLFAGKMCLETLLVNFMERHPEYLAGIGSKDAAKAELKINAISANEIQIITIRNAAFFRKLANAAAAVEVFCEGTLELELVFSLCTTSPSNKLVTNRINGNPGPYFNIRVTKCCYQIAQAYATTLVELGLLSYTPTMSSAPSTPPLQSRAASDDLMAELYQAVTAAFPSGGPERYVVDPSPLPISATNGTPFVTPRGTPSGSLQASPTKMF